MKTHHLFSATIALSLIAISIPALACSPPLSGNLFDKADEQLPGCLLPAGETSNASVTFDNNCDRPIQIKQVNCDSCSDPQQYKATQNKEAFEPISYAATPGVETQNLKHQETFTVTLEITFGDKEAPELESAFDVQENNSVATTVITFRHSDPPPFDCDMYDEGPLGCSSTDSSPTTPLTILFLLVAGMTVQRRRRSQR